MMKKIRLAILLIVLVSLLSACSGVSKEDYEKLVAENKSLQQEITNLKSDNQTLNKKIDNLENGAKNQLVAVRNAFEEKDYKKVILLADKLHKEFNGTDEDVKAQKLLSDSKSEIKKKEEKKKAEEKRLAEEAAKSEKEKAREIIRVSKVYPGSPNSAGGVDLYIMWKNMSDKVIKYAHFDVVPYNSVGDVVECEVRRKSLFTAKDTGPYKKGEGNSSTYYLWENAWYNNTIKSVKLVEIKIDYMDGTSVTLKKNEIPYILY